MPHMGFTAKAAGYMLDRSTFA
ncbi:hypothetical protein EMIT048CA2_120141 [Pseudomonas chlororaphis]